MTQSPWAQSSDSPREPAQPAPQRQSDDRLSQINQIMTLSLWGNSQVNAYLYHVMDDFPKVDPHKHLYSSYSFRTIHTFIMNNVVAVTKNGRCTEENLRDFIEHLVGATPADPEFATDTIDRCIASTKAAKSEYDVSSERPCAEHDARYVTSLYAILMHFTADIMEFLPRNHGYIPHEMVRQMATKADDVVTQLKTGTLAQEALEPRELGHHDNFIQNGYRTLSDYLTSRLKTLHTTAKHTRPQATEEFAMIVGDIDCANAYLTALHDGVSELYSAHEWVGVYEHLAYRKTQECTVSTIPPITANCGIHAYLADFIQANESTHLDPMDARVLLFLFQDIQQQHPTPTPPS